MFFFIVNSNINIKAINGSIITYQKPKNHQEDFLDNIYCATYDELKSIKNILKKINLDNNIKILDENKIRSNKNFPIELGISNKDEFKYIQKYENELEKSKSFITNDKNIDSFTFNHTKTILYKQLNTNKKDIKLAIIGGIGTHIGEIVNSLSAIRLLYTYLNKKFKSVKIDIYINASNNNFYLLHNNIMRKEIYINDILPLSINVKKLFEYDFFIDNSSIQNSIYYQELPFIDSYLYKFGIDYTKIDSSLKHNQLNLSWYKPNSNLVKIIDNLKTKGEIILYHPYSNDNKRTIPKKSAIQLLKKLIKKSNNSTIISTLKIDKFEDDNYIDLSSYSKKYYDLVYIISQMNKIICIDTCIYHIADAFFIPTVVLFTNINPSKRIPYYLNTKAIQIKDKTKNFSQFIFDNDKLSLYKFDGYDDIKVNKVIKLLETI
jgi:hypothetical protein